MIIGRDLLENLGMDIQFSTGSIMWDHASLPMRPPGITVAEAFSSEEQDSPPVASASERIKRILDAKYEKADLNKEVDKCAHLDAGQKQDLLALLKKYEHLFDGTLGKWNSTPYNIQLKEGAIPFHTRPFPIPKVHEQTLKQEVERLVSLGVLKKNQSF